MKLNLGKKPYIYPQPVLIVATYNEDGTPDAMNAAWGGVGDDTQVFLCLSPEHRTVKNILARKAFTVSIADAAHLEQCDYVGIVSGNDVPDKLAKCGLHTEKSAFVDAPVISELPVVLECTLISYDPVHCHLFGEIVNTGADESVCVGNRIDPLNLIRWYMISAAIIT